MKTSKEILSSVLKTTQMGQVGIRSVLDASMRPGLRKALESQLQEYDSIETEAHAIAFQRGWEVKPATSKEFNNPVRKVEPTKYVFKEALLDDGSAESATKNVIADFIDRCLDRNPQVLCSLEDGHRSTCFAHLANIAFKLGRRLEWDAEAERFVGCDEANALLHYAYRPGYALG